MCGIVLLCDAAVPQGERERRVRTALDRLAHRGPDEDGIRSAGDATLGQGRLAIIDLSSSRQPMSDRAGRYFLTYNGEVYNYAELRQGLEPHWDFATHGDTEVVLAGLVRQGPAVLRAAEGMWAFALWDSQRQELLLGRDRMGKKPLYYAGSGAAFACASELSALRALLPGLAWSEDPDAAADYLRYGLCMPGHTIYADVHEVLPGHVLRWSAAGGVRQEPYWSLQCGAYGGSREDAAAEIREAMKVSVQRRLVADVEVGAFLSGGVDSSIIVSVMAGLLGRRPKTFTVGFSEGSFDERAQARAIAAHWGTDHVEALLDRPDPERLVQLVLGHVGQPFGDSSLLPTALVSQITSRHVKVALSGDGGDELFCGYARYRARAALRWLTRVPAGLRRAGVALLRRLPEPTSHHSRSLLKQLHLVADVVERDFAGEPYVAPVLLSRAQLARLAPHLAGRGCAAPAAPLAPTADALQQMMVMDALVYLPQDILLKVDRASMAHSLEARAPFLDRRLVELAFALPPAWHRDGLRGKAMLRRAFAGLVPDAVWQRPKQGFAVPVHAWFRGPLAATLQRLADDSAGGGLQPQAVRAMLDEHRNGVRDHGYRLWNIYVYLLWRSSGARPQ
ncbi:MAG: asparagine synthase (glutamine-hydrolyzing) [Nevskia sp.]|nr:asparagine synthase (glutamine-hydrolyzing) [Nevskia sp.]